MPKIIACCLALVLSAAGAQAFEILYAVDGDSLQGGNNKKARLLCIDAPELYQSYGKQAKRQLQRLINRGGVTVKTTGKDHHGRHLVLLSDKQGDSINLSLIQSGHAWVARRHADDCGLPAQKLFRAERAAKQAKRGLWRQANAKPPWQWRKENPRR